MIKSHFDNKYFQAIEEVAHQNNYFLNVLDRLNDSIDLKGMSVLDVGCGSGAFISPILKFGVNNLVGVDGPNSFSDLCLKRGYGSVDFVEDLCTDALPFYNEKFDLIIAKDVFEHLINPEFALSEVYRVLKPGGFFLFHVPNHFTLKGRVKFLVTNNIDTYCFFPESTRWNYPHVRFYRYRDTLDFMKKNQMLLHKNYCDLYFDFPLINRVPILQKAFSKMAIKNPDAYASALTLLFKKISLAF